MTRPAQPPITLCNIGVIFMRGKNIFYLFIGLTLLFSLSAIAEETSGPTADGCTYKVINGQYLTSCPKRDRRPHSRWPTTRPIP